MKNDILPPVQRPDQPPTEPRQEPAIIPPPDGSSQHAETDQFRASLPPIVDQQPAGPVTGSTKNRKRLWMTIGVIVGLFVAGIILGIFWYHQSLKPVSQADAKGVRLVIQPNTTPSQIGQQLHDSKVIRSAMAFDIYTRLSDVRNRLQAGSFVLSPSESTPEIVSHLLSGKVDEMTLTFYPGATLRDTTSKADNKKIDHRSVLLRAGYSETEIEAAFNKTYNHPLFEGKPASADLEGYIYGETYNFSSAASVEQILIRTFDEYYAQITDNNLIEGYRQHGMNLYQAITLASIIQREVPNLTDQRQVAQVFYTRLERGMPLGSDVTYHYAADKRGVERDFTLDDPYNTRKYAGLPPGPIASPGASALQAVANPAEGDYVYFLSGDDDVTYYGRTDAEHESNIQLHCAYKCSLP